MKGYWLLWRMDDRMMNSVNQRDSSRQTKKLSSNKQRPLFCLSSGNQRSPPACSIYRCTTLRATVNWPQRLDRLVISSLLSHIPSFPSPAWSRRIPPPSPASSSYPLVAWS